jgi:hypothetical protein
MPIAQVRRDVVHLRRPSCYVQDLHNIEPERVTPTAVSERPDACHARNGASLLPSDRLPGRPVPARTPGLHLDEGHHVVPPDDQIEVVAAQTEAVGLDDPPA